MEIIMEVFPAEIEDGLQEIVSSKACVTYATQAIPYNDTIVAGKHFKSLASMSDEDLYYVQSILVSSSWNKNDDIFDKAEVWSAKHTPEDKPTNLEHDENTIIGHIVSNYPITEDGILIDENTPIENLPNKYHILTGSVIYKGFSNPELRGRADKLISEIESGEKYVSMECFFKGFDYGLVNQSNGSYQILPRNKETAHLTKHLRAYGGQGEHEGFKIGRVLRGITFSGKGFVNKPANPDSIIFTENSIQVDIPEKKEQKNNDLSIAGVSNNQLTFNSENNTMSLETETTGLTEKVESTTDCSEAVKEAQATANELKEKTIALETAIETNETILTETKAQLEAALAEKEEAAKKWYEEMKKKEEEKDKMKAALDEALEALAGYKAKEEEMLKKEKKMKRIASLLEAGIANEVAASTVDKFEGLEDDAFEAMTVLLASKSPVSIPAEPVIATEEPVVDTADASVLDTVETVEEVNLGVGGDSDNSVESTRAALVEYVCSRLGKKAQ
jgi:hypothetical protein